MLRYEQALRISSYDVMVPSVPHLSPEFDVDFMGMKILSFLMILAIMG